VEDGTGTRAYAPLEEIEDSPQYAHSVARRALEEAKQFRIRYQRFERFFGPIFSGIDEAERRLGEEEKKHSKPKGKKKPGRKPRKP
jgi:hypothetical protein